MTSLLPLASILPRPQDTRPLKLAHVEALMESIREYPSYGIALLGLIQPITVDSQGVLLAVGHRRESAKPEAFAEHYSAGALL
jgi:ParB-like chromosome segregation protein Spo0J